MVAKWIVWVTEEPVEAYPVSRLTRSVFAFFPSGSFGDTKSFAKLNDPLPLDKSVKSTLIDRKTKPDFRLCLPRYFETPSTTLRE